jgi:hypothetical protein
MGLRSKRKFEKKKKSRLAIGALVGQSARTEEEQPSEELPVPVEEAETPAVEVFNEERQTEEQAEAPGAVKPSKKPTIKGKQETFNMCLICMGIIKHGLAMFVCKCNKVYHVSCGRRLGKCPHCSADLTEDMIIGKEEKAEEVKVDYEALPVPKLRLSIEDKQELLEERFVLGEISEDVYKELKAKYRKEQETGTEFSGDEVYRCPSCDNIVDKNAARCSCGAIFSDKEGFLCPECNKFVPNEANVCTYCGIRFSGEGIFVCPSCGKTLPWGIKECSCGTVFSDELVEGFQCPECGNFLEANAKKCDSCGVVFL